MAVPKKRTSKAKKNARKANWKRKGYKEMPILNLLIHAGWRRTTGSI